MLIDVTKLIQELKNGNRSTVDSRIFASLFENGNLIYVEYIVLTEECLDGFEGDTIRKFVGKNQFEALLGQNNAKSIRITRIESR